VNRSCPDNIAYTLAAKEDLIAMLEEMLINNEVAPPSTTWIDDPKDADVAHL
jgi:hypothetical protein